MSPLLLVQSALVPRCVRFLDSRGRVPDCRITASPLSPRGRGLQKLSLKGHVVLRPPEGPDLALLFYASGRAFFPPSRSGSAILRKTTFLN